MKRFNAGCSSIGRARFALATSLMITHASGAVAHGFAGARFLATILTPDPFVADEMSLPTALFNPPTPDGAKEIDIEADLAKRITPDLGFTLSHQWERLKQPGVPAVTGLCRTLNTELDYQLLLNAPHQALGTISVNAGFGHTGRVQALGAPYFINVSPVINFGKGFGDLPESIFWLKPFVISGMVSFAFPTKTQSAGLRSANTSILVSPSSNPGVTAIRDVIATSRKGLQRRCRHLAERRNKQHLADGQPQRADPSALWPIACRQNLAVFRDDSDRADQPAIPRAAAFQRSANAWRSVAQSGWNRDWACAFSAWWEHFRDFAAGDSRRRALTSAELVFLAPDLTRR
jgi:hypothetical protein